MREGTSRGATAGRVTGIDHVQLAMPAGQEERARGFYQGLLGMMEIPKPAHVAARGGCWFAGGAARVHLGIESDFRPALKAHPGLLVDDLAALIAALEAAGYPTLEDQPLEGYWRTYVSDPFGNRLELMQAL